ncbi:MAG: hypothetical protein HQ515_19155 [Phycisphaeraceae bacterium]|nr:hypothetical protein [Phycisphaeraceae bacterium]
MSFGASRIECGDARQYFCDWLDEQRKEKIPQAVQAHIRECHQCREEIRSLGQIMKSAASSYPDVACHVSSLNASLAAHFKYAETPITCARAKRFLPGLASRKMQITIPTPITQHIEQCHTCRKNGLLLRSLNLSDAQLQRLTECLEEGSEKNALMVDHLSDEQVALFACIDYTSFQVSSLEHVCKCASCRERILWARQTATSQLKAKTTGCEDISYQDLFDLAVPLGFNALAEESTKERECIIQHVCHCEGCLRRLGVLDQVLVNFLSPHDSGIVTDYCLDSDETGAERSIQVQAYKARDAKDSVSSRGGKTLSARVRPNLGWMKAAAVVAVLLGVTIFSMLPKAGAGFLDQVYESTTNVAAVHITVSLGDDPVVRKEHWIFPPHRAVTIQEKTKIVYDAKAGTVATTDITGSRNEVVLQSDLRESLQRQIRGLFNLWPLNMSQSATLTSEDRDGMGVYELCWSQGTRTYRWIAHVDQATHRVQKVDRFSGTESRGMMKDGSYDVHYPTPEEVEAFLRERKIVLH